MTILCGGAITGWSSCISAEVLLFALIYTVYNNIYCIYIALIYTISSSSIILGELLLPIDCCCFTLLLFPLFKSASNNSVIFFNLLYIH